MASLARSTPSTSGAIAIARLRPLHGDHRPLLGRRGQPDLEVSEFGLEIILHMGEHARRAAGRRRHMEAVGRDARDDAVVHEETGLAQHEAIAAAADLELLEGVGVHALEKRRRVGADDLDLAERRGVEQADAGAGRAAFARDRFVHRFVGAAENTRRASKARRPRRRRRFPAAQSWIGVRRIGIEQVAARGSGEGAESHRRIGLAEGREADLGDRLLRARRRRWRARSCWRACPGRSPCRSWCSA